MRHFLCCTLKTSLIKIINWRSWKKNFHVITRSDTIIYKFRSVKFYERVSVDPKILITKIKIHVYLHLVSNKRNFFNTIRIQYTQRLDNHEKESQNNRHPPTNNQIRKRAPFARKVRRYFPATYTESRLKKNLVLLLLDIIIYR